MDKLHFQNSGCICESAWSYVFICLSPSCTGSCHHRFTLQNEHSVSIIKTAFEEGKSHLHNIEVKKANLHQLPILFLLSNSSCLNKIYLWAVLWNFFFVSLSPFLFPYLFFFFLYFILYVQLQMHTVSPSLFQDNS